MTHSADWNALFEAKPDDDNYGYEIDNYIRQLKIAIRERMELQHYWKDSTTLDGKHMPGYVTGTYVGTKSSFPTATQGAEAIATDESNRPYVCLVDGTWTVRPVGYIGANIDVLAGVTIDGIDVSAHAAGTAKSQHTAGMGDHTHLSAGAEGGLFTSSLAESGYIKIGGIILQWGKETVAALTGTTTFSLAFPTACYNVVLTICEATTAGSDRNPYVHTLTTTNFQWCIGEKVLDFYWVAIGK